MLFRHPNLSTANDNFIAFQGLKIFHVYNLFLWFKKPTIIIKTYNAKDLKYTWKFIENH